MKLLYTIIMTLVVLFIITFSLANTNPVHLGYYDFININVATYLLIFISFGVGIIFAGFMGIVERFRLSREVRRLKKEVKELEKKMPVEKMPVVQETKTEETAGKWNL
ncbi:MAG: LapA family protein [Syntrophobacterales bacterium]|nr:MAG: LapA family protein [Syntrophobacterales bacterium]